MKENFEHIQLEIYSFQNEDVIATSGLELGEDEFPIMMDGAMLP